MAAPAPVTPTLVSTISILATVPSRAIYVWTVALAGCSYTQTVLVTGAAQPAMSALTSKVLNALTLNLLGSRVGVFMLVPLRRCGTRLAIHQRRHARRMTNGTGRHVDPLQQTRVCRPNMGAIWTGIHNCSAMGAELYGAKSRRFPDSANTQDSAFFLDLKLAT